MAGSHHMSGISKRYPKILCHSFDSHTVKTAEKKYDTFRWIHVPIYKSHHNWQCDKYSENPLLYITMAALVHEHHFGFARARFSWKIYFDATSAITSIAVCEQFLMHLSSKHTHGTGKSWMSILQTELKPRETKDLHLKSIAGRHLIGLGDLKIPLEFLSITLGTKIPLKI